MILSSSLSLWKKFSMARGAFIDYSSWFPFSFRSRYHDLQHWLRKSFPFKPINWHFLPPPANQHRGWKLELLFLEDRIRSWKYMRIKLLQHSNTTASAEYIRSRSTYSSLLLFEQIHAAYWSWEQKNNLLRAGEEFGDQQRTPQLIRLEWVVTPSWNTSVGLAGQLEKRKLFSNIIIWLNLTNIYMPRAPRPAPPTNINIYPRNGKANVPSSHVVILTSYLCMQQDVPVLSLSCTPLHRFCSINEGYHLSGTILLSLLDIHSARFWDIEHST